MEKREFDIGIVVPLKEEFRYVIEIAPQLESISHEGTYFYRLDFGAISAVCCLVDQMGPLPAMQATIRLLDFTDVKLVVVLGLGGALDDDVSIGDVVIGTEVNEFQANSKAESTEEGYEVRYSGRHWPLEYRIREAITHFEFSGDDAFTSWQTETSGDYLKLDVADKESVCSSPASLYLGPVASGNVVAAASAFVDEVKRINRKFMAIDMEAAGVAAAAAERIHPLPCLVVRGMSDPANEGKKILDKQGKGAWRRYCVRNATSLLRNLLRWEGFLSATGLMSPTPPSDSENIAGELVLRLKSYIGGPWLVGVVFDIYSHGPRVIDDEEVVPMDLSSLRITDSRVGELLEAADRLKEELLPLDDLQMMADAFAKLIEDFRARLGSAKADSLLQSFDRVVTEILYPEKQNEQDEALLLEATRLEEEVGPEAVIELLRGFASGSPPIRERYVDALANAERWDEVIDTVRNLDSADLTRRELEHGIFAGAKTRVPDYASELMMRHQHEYDDNGARLFRREVLRQYPGMGKDASGGKI
jgi:nucleoside phosphorylase